MHKRLLSVIAAALSVATFSSTAWSQAWSQNDYRISQGYGGGTQSFASYQNGLASQPNLGAPPPSSGGSWVDSFALPATPTAVQPFQPAPSLRQAPYNANPYGGGSSFQQAPYSSNPAPSFEQDATTVRVKPRESEPLTSGITAHDLHVLGQHDVAVVVDRSLSMTTQDCPGISPAGGGWQGALAGLIGSQIVGYPVGPAMGHGGLSRWDFVQGQTMALAKQTEQILPQGLLLVLFSSHVRVFKNVDLRQIPQIFAMNHPWGSTQTADALAVPIRDYFARKAASGGHVKPLAIAVITDGMPTNPQALRELIIETTRRMQNPHEISITFLQIGTEREGVHELQELDNYLVNEGARYDIVTTKLFPQVVQAGLARSLVDAISQNH
jgi:hypothetical protein